MSAVTISVVVPVYNGEAFVADAVESIRGQTVVPDQIIVVDDGSTDHSADLAASLGGDVHVHRRETNGGLACARNDGVAVANGDLIAFLDVDDLWSADKTAIQAAMLAEHDAVDVVMGRTRRLRSTTGPDGARHFEPWGDAETMLSMGSGLFRRRALDRVGPLDPALPFTCDWDWFMRARELGLRLRLHDDVVQHYRRHGDNLTEDEETGNQQTLAMLSMSLKRRRAAGGSASSLPDLDREDAE